MNGKLYRRVRVPFLFNPALSSAKVKKMKKAVKILPFLISALFLAWPLFGGEELKIRRIRKVPNRFPEIIAGDEILEANFTVQKSGWLAGVGWSLRLYDRGKKLTEAVTTAYFDPRETPTCRIEGRRFKGKGNFTAFFPLRGDPAYLVLIMGPPGKMKVALLPSSELVEEFNISPRDVQPELMKSDYRFLEKD